MIQYRDDAKVTAEEAIDLYIRSTLGERRPVNNKETFEAMLKNANLDRKSTRLNSSHIPLSRMPSSA